MATDEEGMTSPDPRLTAYLLGSLSEAEAAALERECFERSEVFVQLVDAETALVDDYVRRRLPAHDRDRFERHYLLSPHNQRRVEFAEALARKVDRTQPPRVSAPAAFTTGPWQLAIAAALVLLTASTAWLWFQAHGLRRELARSEQSRIESEQRGRDLAGRLASEEARARASTSPADSPQTPANDTPPPAAAAPPVVALLLRVPSTRAPASGSPPTLTVPAGAGEVHIQLAITDVEYPSYEVVLRGIPASLVITRPHLRPQGSRASARLNVVVPPGRLTAGDYLLSLSGERAGKPSEPVSELLFRVVTPNRR
jgi:hypothetical protein